MRDGLGCWWLAGDDAAPDDAAGLFTAWFLGWLNRNAGL